MFADHELLFILFFLCAAASFVAGWIIGALAEYTKHGDQTIVGVDWSSISEGACYKSAGEMYISIPAGELERALPQGEKSRFSLWYKTVKRHGSY